jgi:hypothetical protein
MIWDWSAIVAVNYGVFVETHYQALPVIGKQGALPSKICGEGGIRTLGTV